MDGNPQGLSRN